MYHHKVSYDRHASTCFFSHTEDEEQCLKLKGKGKCRNYMRNLLDFIRVRDEIISELEEIELVSTKMTSLTQA